MDRPARDSDPTPDRSAADLPEPGLPPAADERRPGTDLDDLRDRLPVASRADADAADAEADAAETDSDATPEAEELEIRYNEHVEDGQMVKRGWTAEHVRETINNPHRTLPALDRRYNEQTGTRNDEPATYFINEDNSYVVRRDADGDIVQLSNRNKPDWRRPFT